MKWRWLPKIVAGLLLWSVPAYMVWRVEPAQVKDLLVPGLYLPMVAGVGIASWYSLLTIFRNWKYATMMSFLLMGTLILLILRVMNVLILIALLGIAGSLSLTLVKRS